jgi:hypothetical protein
MIRVVDCERVYPMTPWMLEDEDTGTPVALCWDKLEAENLALYYNSHEASS